MACAYASIPISTYTRQKRARTYLVFFSSHQLLIVFRDVLYFLHLTIDLDNG